MLCLADVGMLPRRDQPCGAAEWIVVGDLQPQNPQGCVRLFGIGLKAVCDEGRETGSVCGDGDVDGDEAQIVEIVCFLL